MSVQSAAEGTTDALAITTAAASGRPPSRLRAFRTPLTLGSSVWLLILVVVSLLATWIAPMDPIQQDLGNALALPNASNLLGTDQLGRDVLSRLIHGGGATLVGALQAVVIAIVLGVPIGMAAGYFGGWLDSLAARWSDLLLTVPGIIVLLTFLALFGGSNTIAMTSLGVLLSAGFLRLARGAAKSIRSELYVDAAKVSGLSGGQILARHMAPHVLAPIIVHASVSMGFAILTQAGLGFLGLGPPPPAPNWGQMIAEASQLMSASPWLMVPPGVVIVLTVMALNFIGDGVRDMLPQTERPDLLAPANYATPASRPSIDESRPAGTATGSPVTQELLSVQDLTVSFASGTVRYPVVDGVSFDLRQGEALGLVGESGCGKTMTALALMGLIPGAGRIDAGHIVLGGEDLAAGRERAFAAVRGRRIAYVAQEPMLALDPSFTVGSLLREPLRLAGLNRKAAHSRALELLDSVGIPRPEAVAKSFPHQLSGGMAQRVAIALALSNEPEILIADEPTTALDVTVQAEILDLLRTHQQSLNMALLLVTHDLAVVADICSRAIVMYAGQVVEQGSVDQLFSHPGHPYTASLLESRPDLAQPGGLLPTIPGSVPAPRDWPSSCRFAPRCPIAVQECTSGPIHLREPSAEHLSRCLRTDDLLRGRV